MASSSLAFSFCFFIQYWMIFSFHSAAVLCMVLACDGTVLTSISKSSLFLPSTNSDVLLKVYITCASLAIAEELGLLCTK